MSSIATPLSAVEAARSRGVSRRRAPPRSCARRPSASRARTVLTCSWQRTSSVLVHLIASNGLDVRIVEVDTGLLFPGTHEVRDRLIDRSASTVETLRPRRTVAEQAEDQGSELWLRDPDACCGLRKVEPLERALEGTDAWVSGVRRSSGGERATVRPFVVRRHAKRGAGRSALALDVRGRRRLLRRARPAGARAARAGLPLDRLHALHAPGRSRRGRARRSLGLDGQDRVRPAPPLLTYAPQLCDMAARARLHPRRPAARRGRAPRHAARRRQRCAGRDDRSARAVRPRTSRPGPSRSARRPACLPARSRRAASALAEEGLEARGVEVVGPRPDEQGGVVVSLVDAPATGRWRPIAARRPACARPTSIRPGSRVPDDLHLSGYSLLREPIARAAHRAAWLARRVRLWRSVDLAAAPLIEAYGAERFRDELGELAPESSSRRRSRSGDRRPAAGAIWVRKRGPEGCEVLSAASA